VDDTHKCGDKDLPQRDLPLFPLWDPLHLFLRPDPLVPDVVLWLFEVWPACTVVVHDALRSVRVGHSGRSEIGYTARVGLAFQGAEVLHPDHLAAK
jgi:hypothetical protein